MTASPQQRLSAIEALDTIAALEAGQPPALFLDFDGTLAPIVPRPEDAALSPEMRNAIERAVARGPVAVVSGRDLADVRARIGIPGLAYAGSHGFDIQKADGEHVEHPEAARFLPALDAAEAELTARLATIPGALVDRKRFALAVHYRLCAPADVPRVATAVEVVAGRHKGLGTHGGKMVFELRPVIDWHKGKAILFLLDALAEEDPNLLPVFIGDDVTDEDGFAAIRGRGVGIRVGDPTEPSAAAYALADTEEVRLFLDLLAAR